MFRRMRFIPFVTLLGASFCQTTVTSHEFFFHDSCTNHSNINSNYSVVETLRNRTISTVQSIFNCDLSDAKCSYYYPAHFFDSECGIGRSFRWIIDDTQAKMKDGSLWVGMPAIGFPTVRVLKPTTEQSETPLVHSKSSTPLAGEHLSFIHVHKSGGSSLHDAFNTLSSNHKASLTRHRWWSPGGIQDSRMQEKTRSDLKHAITYPSSLPFATDDHVIFAVVRNPVERFISSIGQAFGTYGLSCLFFL